MHLQRVHYGQAGTMKHVAGRTQTTQRVMHGVRQPSNPMQCKCSRHEGAAVVYCKTVGHLRAGQAAYVVLFVGMDQIWEKLQAT